MVLMKEDLQAIGELMDVKLEPIKSDISNINQDVAVLKEDVADIKVSLREAWKNIGILQKQI